jgi:hypothetical protein
VESTVKQIDRRTKLSGAQWKEANVPQVLVSLAINNVRNSRHSIDSRHPFRQRHQALKGGFSDSRGRSQPHRSRDPTLSGQ